MHGFEISDLHGGCRAQDIGGLSHKLGGFHFSASSDDLGFTDTLRLSSHRKGVLEIVAEDDVFDEHGLDLDTPAHCDVLDDLTDGLGNLFPALDDVLKDAGTNDVTEGGLGTLDQSLANVGDSESSLVRRGNVVVDDRCEVERDIVLCHANLAWHLDDLDLDIDLNEALGERIDENETRVNGASELAELGDQADVSLRYWLVRVRADDAAGNGTEETDARSKRVDWKIVLM